MMKTLRFLLFSIFALAFIACSKMPPPPPPSNFTTTSGVYILNSGKWNSNNSVLSFYDTKTGQVINDVFFARNGKKLGDTANDLLVYGSKMYIAVNGSAVVFVTDLNGTLLKEIKVDNESSNLSPRKFATGNGKVYVTYQEGYLGEIDTTLFNVRTTPVGPFPEGVVVLDNKVYTANSDGYNPQYGNTVSIVDIASFKQVATIEVNRNPQTLHKTKDGDLYLVCYGNYADESSSLLKIDTKNNTATTIQNVSVTNMSICGDIAYILNSSYDEMWNQTVNYYKYDLTNDALIGEFIQSDLVTPNGYSLFTDTVLGNVYIGASDYVNNGDMYIFSPNAQQITKFDTGGLNPIAIAFIHE